MSIHRYAANADKASPEIVEAIRAEGWDVNLIRLPCDLLCWHPVLDVWQPLEVKTPGRRNHESKISRESQRKFLTWTDVPVVTTPDEALTALRKHYPAPTPPAELIAWARRLKAGFEAEWEATGKAAGARERVERKVGQAEGSTGQLFPIGGVS